MKIDEIKQAVVELDEEQAPELIKQALAEGVDARTILDNGVLAGLKVIGDLFQTQEYFLAELMIGGKLVDTCIKILDPHLPKAPGPKRGVVVIGAVEGDLHSIGYGMVAKQLELAGYEVHSVGIDVPAMTFIDKAQEVTADIIGLSAFLVTTIPSCNQVIDYLKDLGIKSKIKVIIGGTETNQAAADAMGADGWAPNAVEAVKLCDNLLGHTA